MKLKDKLFIIINDQPHLNPIGIRIPEFEKLWKADKSVEKVQYAKELAYIYHMWEYDSPYYDRKNKEEEIIRDFIGKKYWRKPKRVTEALDKYKSLDETAERRALDASIAACDGLAEDLIKLRQDTDQLEIILSDLDQAMKEEEEIGRRVDLMKMKLDLQEQKMKIARASIEVMARLEKTIETAISLRKKVTKSVFKGENSDSMIGDFLYDKLMSKMNHEANQSLAEEEIKEVDKRLKELEDEQE